MPLPWLRSQGSTLKYQRTEGRVHDTKYCDAKNSRSIIIRSKNGEVGARLFVRALIHLALLSHRRNTPIAWTFPARLSILSIMSKSFIELFAGCGGLSLGLRSAGFTELAANELSSMPAETFALNLMGIDLRSEEFANTPINKRNVLWIDSSSSDIVKRLNDNPFERPETDMPELSGIRDFTGKLIVGDIRRLNTFIENRHSPLIHGEVDLVSGGPPCQSFSLAGRREFGNQRNQLPWEFAKFVNVQRPRMVLLENVEGILRPFKLEDHTYYAWFEVCKAFASIGYVTCPLLVNARLAGVAQNRPRFIMIAVREDLTAKLSSETADWFQQGIRLVETVRKDSTDAEYDRNQWTYRDLNESNWQQHARQTVFAPLVAFSEANSQRTVFDAIGDLQLENTPSKSPYVRNLNNLFSPLLADPQHSMMNTRIPVNTPRVRARFRLYQTIARGGKEMTNEVRSVLRRQKTRLSGPTVEYLLGTDLLDYGYGIPDDESSLMTYLDGLATKKFSQKALLKHQPAPAALSIPDDICHYEEARTLSVREMARIQSFPDAFEFRGIPTTGGARRSYQVPQYTQIGNAVPPLLGNALGTVISSILDELR